MGRATKFLAAAIAVVAFSGVLAAGAVGPTTTTPVKLCIAKGGIVRLPTASNPCSPSKESTFTAASAADVAALAARMDTNDTLDISQESGLTGLDNRLDAAETGKADQSDLDALVQRVSTLERPVIITEPVNCSQQLCDVHITASGLKPGSTFTVTVYRSNETVLGEPMSYTVNLSGAVDEVWAKGNYAPVVLNDFIKADGTSRTGQPAHYDSRTP